jgi:hypothetical protein
MDEASIIKYVTDTFAGVDVERPQPGHEPAIAVGDTFFIYDPHRNLEPKFRFPFATIVTKDYGDFDRFSNLDRPGVFRLNIGVGKETYRKLLGEPPAAGAPTTGHDFAVLDHLLPHPTYAAHGWVCVLNPSAATFEGLRPLLAEAYSLSVVRSGKKPKN